MARTLVTLGEIERARGKSKVSFDYFKRALEILLLLPDENDPDLIKSIDSILSLINEGAETSSDITLELFEKLAKTQYVQSRPSEYAFVLDEIALIHLRKGDFEKCLGYFKRCGEVQTSSQLVVEYSGTLRSMGLFFFFYSLFLLNDI